MPHKTKIQAQKIQNGACTVFEYGLDTDNKIDTAYIELRGRYPENQRATNLLCKEIVYIQNGHGMICINGISTELNKGDVILIEPGEGFYWEGTLDMVVSCAPAWTEEQHKTIP
jgi:mannose-6-phosphate isomerase-like protein (cupin superfamily)